MKYFKNTELAKLYNVSEKSVRNWIQSAQEGKLGLELHNTGGRFYVANTSQNTFAIEQLVKKGKKYRNSRGTKRIKPDPGFYQKYSLEEIHDIISNIDIRHEVPHKYSYYGEGAKEWDEYTNKMAKQPYPNLLTSTVDLLRLSHEYIEELIHDYTKVNVIDLGVGNGYPAKDFVKWLLDKEQLGRYIALDASPDMVSIAENNFHEWFGDQVKFERRIVDISYDKFDDLSSADKFALNDESTLNIVLYLGGTIVNLRDPALSLRMISNSLSKDDLLIMSRKLDTPQARRFFDFGAESNGGKLIAQDKVILDLLGINESYYEVEQFYSLELNQRIIQVRLRVDLIIDFELDGKRRSVEINKEEAILIWRAHHQALLDIVNQFDENGLDIVQCIKTKDQQYAQVMAKIKQSA
jgi:SAM-dependent methyltransferase